ncbi:MAG: hypothetical protein ACXWRA_02175 [Pseudobdellovibrionaceae bacterium]
MLTIQLSKNLILWSIAGWMLLSFYFITPAMCIGSIAYFCLLTGMLHRKNIKIHVPLMNIGILLDISLVILLEVQRQAINTALSMKLNGLQQLHILVSTIAVLLYFSLSLSGWLKLKGEISSPRFTLSHRRIGPWAFFFRSMGYLLMFSMLMPRP